jgi:hypothetical protein
MWIADAVSGRAGIRKQAMQFNRFDVSAKELVWDDLAAWLERLVIGPRGPVEIIDSDITALTAGVNLVPLAPLTGVPESGEGLRDLVQRMAERINAEPAPRAAKLWTAT